MKIDQFFDIKLPVDDLNYVIIQFVSPTWDISRFDHVNVVAHTAEHKKIVIYSLKYWIWLFIDDLKESLTKAYKGELVWSQEQANQLCYQDVYTEFRARHDLSDEEDEKMSEDLMRHMAFDPHGSEPTFIYTIDTYTYIEVIPSRSIRLLDDEEANITWPEFYSGIKDLLKPLVTFKLSQQDVGKWLYTLDVLQTYAYINYLKTYRALDDPQLISRENPPGSINRGYDMRTYPVRDHTTLDICRYHDQTYGTDPHVHQMFLNNVDLIYKEFIDFQDSLNVEESHE